MVNFLNEFLLNFRCAQSYPDWCYC